MDGMNENYLGSAKPANMEDLNDDCLVEIFRHLDLVDLGNMCELSERFKMIAVQVFSCNRGFYEYRICCRECKK